MLCLEQLRAPVDRAEFKLLGHRGHGHLVAEERRGLQTAAAGIRATADLCQCRPDVRGAEIDVEHFGQDGLGLDCEHRKLRRHHHPVARWRNHAQSAFPCHQLGVDEVVGANCGQALIGELAAHLDGARKHASAERVDARKAVRGRAVHGHIWLSLRDQLRHAALRGALDVGTKDVAADQARCVLLNGVQVHLYLLGLLRQQFEVPNDAVLNDQWRHRYGHPV